MIDFMFADSLDERNPELLPLKKKRPQHIGLGDDDAYRWLFSGTFGSQTCAGIRENENKW
jgi:hypothetical protein